MAVTTVTTTMAGAINYTVVTDTSADWPSVANSTYFYDKADKLVHYKDGAGAIQEIFSAAGGLTYFTEAQNTTAPNATVPVNSLTPVTATTNADIAIVPKGTGAFMLDIPDSTSAGGNKRGTNAVDLQTFRSNATMVASGQSATISGGETNTASGPVATVAGGASNVSSSFRTVVSGGILNTASGVHATVGGGYNNVSSGEASFTVGEANTASGLRAISIGQSNIASGSNSSSMGYGNSNAGGQGCAAIGWSNTITAGASYGAFAVGQQNTVSGQGFAVGVQNNIVNGWALGQTNTVAGGVAIGLSNTANGSNSIAIGRQSSSFSIKSRITYSAGQMGTLGDSQKSTFILQNRTTGSTATTLIINYGDSITPFSTNQVILSNNSAYRFKGTVVAKKSGTVDVAAWDIDGLIVRGANAAATTLTISTVLLVSNLPLWGTPTLAADTTNGGLQVQVTGATATNIQWTAVIETTEVIYA